MVFSSKESISKIQNYLQEGNVLAFIEFIEPKGASAKKISQYLREEIKKMNLNSDRSRFTPV
jgi:hypothetical protein